eukprot:TRINITY_DN827_c2_g1_i1.p1 TRINITY_DN827_c2_g1~~TRINITY_DN827_c2_g1_i1.p1  ORF type:complete len:843 (-),score=218.65 TRINITY_DN827_c2_g1_i1:33-2561(-)
MNTQIEVTIVKARGVTLKDDEVSHCVITYKKEKHVTTKTQTMEWNDHLLLQIEPTNMAPLATNKSSSHVDILHKILVKIIVEGEGGKSKPRTIGMVNIPIPGSSQLEKSKHGNIEQWYPMTLIKTEGKDSSLLVRISFPLLSRKHSLDSIPQIAINNSSHDPLSKPPLPASPPKDRLPGPDDEKLRRGAIHELILTEEQYVKDLGIVIDLFYKPIQANGWLDPRELATLFSNVEAVREVNVGLLNNLKEHQQIGNIGECVGEIFLEKADLFKLYAIYCSNQPTLSKTLTKYRAEKPELRDYLEKTFLLPECRLLELDSFLIQPLQRICKYPLLLKELVKVTESTHVDYQNLTLSVDKIKEVVDKINERTRQVENVIRMQEIEKTLISKTASTSDWLVTSTRFLVKTGTLLRLKSSKKSGSDSVRHATAADFENLSSGSLVTCFLFNDLFIITTLADKKPQKNQAGPLYTVEYQMPLNAIVIKSSEQIFDGFETREELQKVFEVVHTQQQIHRLKAASKIEADMWLSDFRKHCSSSSPHSSSSSYSGATPRHATINFGSSPLLPISSLNLTSPPSIAVNNSNNNSNVGSSSNPNSPSVTSPRSPGSPHLTPPVANRKSHKRSNSSLSKDNIDAAREHMIIKGQLEFELGMRTKAEEKLKALEIKFATLEKENKYLNKKILKLEDENSSLKTQILSLETEKSHLIEYNTNHTSTHHHNNNNNNHNHSTGTGEKKSTSRREPREAIQSKVKYFERMDGGEGSSGEEGKGGKMYVGGGAGNGGRKGREGGSSSRERRDTGRYLAGGGGGGLSSRSTEDLLGHVSAVTTITSAMADTGTSSSRRIPK